MEIFGLGIIIGLIIGAVIAIVCVYACLRDKHIDNENSCDSDEYYEWEEHEWEVKEVIYDITPREKKKTDNKSETREGLNSADDLPF